MEGTFEYRTRNIEQRGYADERALGQDNQSRLCPFVSMPFDDCYCTSTSSMVVESTINFCGGNYRQCEIYGKNKGNG
jgi:hypothetical protein